MLASANFIHRRGRDDPEIQGASSYSDMNIANPSESLPLSPNDETKTRASRSDTQPVRVSPGYSECNSCDGRNLLRPESNVPKTGFARHPAHVFVAWQRSP